MPRHSRRAGALVTSAALAVLPSTSPAQSAAPTPRTLTAAEWRADLRTMMDSLRVLHRDLYHATSRTTFDSAAAALDARIPSLSRDEIIMGMARIVALARDGHSNIYPTRDRVIGFHTLPVALYLFRDGLYVRAADSAHAGLLGGRITRIGDASADEAYQRVQPYIGRDNEMGARFFAPPLLAMPEVLHALHLAPDADSARFTLELDGHPRVVWLHAAGPAPLMASDADDGWVRRPGWVDARDATPGPDPLWLRYSPDSVFWWFTPVPGTHAVYAQVNQIRDARDGTMEDFATRLLSYLDTAHVDRLVLDLRLDRGGNGDLRMPLVRGLLRQPRVNTRGKLIVLEGRATFSAAQFLLDDLDGYSDAVFIGEPSGSRGVSYGDSRKFTLPNSGITVRAASRYWQQWSADDPRPWIAPDEAAEMTFADYRAKRDPALATALAYVASAPLPDRLWRAVAAGDTTGARSLFHQFRTDPAHVYVDGEHLIDDAALHFYRRGDRDRAAWLFALAAEAYPTSVRAHLNAAALYQETKRPALARRELERVLALDPANADARASLRQLGPG